MKPENLNFLIKDMKNNGGASAWDWEADYRFACHLGDEETAEIILAAIQSHAPENFRVYAMMKCKRITDLRLRIMRKLVRDGVARAYWAGTGEGGKSRFGVNKIRHYQLIKV